jgi:putative ABC transport system substrate-binding protein
MRRREFLSLVVGAAVAWPVVARAQQSPKVLRIGITTVQTRNSPPYVALDQRLRELGYVDGQNLAVEFLNPDTVAGGVGEAVRTLVRNKVDVIVATVESALKAALAATDSVPIVMIAIDYDPISQGYIKSLARPTGNVTGLFLQQIELAAKRLQLLKDAVSDLQAATMFWDTPSAAQWKTTESAATSIGLRLAGIELQKQPYDYEQALAQAPPNHRRALIMPTSAVFYRDRRQIADLAIRHRMASMFVLREWVDDGGLMSYGASFPSMFRRAAEYIDKIARGTNPTDLPVEQPTKFEFVINLKTAKAIGLQFHAQLLATADEVIE